MTPETAKKIVEKAKFNSDPKNGGSVLVKAASGSVLKWHKITNDDLNGRDWFDQCSLCLLFGSYKTGRCCDDNFENFCPLSCLEKDSVFRIAHKNIQNSDDAYSFSKLDRGQRQLVMNMRDHVYRGCAEILGIELTPADKQKGEEQ